MTELQLHSHSQCTQAGAFSPNDHVGLQPRKSRISGPGNFLFNHLTLTIVLLVKTPWPIYTSSISSTLSLSFCYHPARYAMQQFHKSKETKLPIRVPNPIMKNSMNGDRRAKTKFLYTQYHRSG